MNRQKATICLLVVLLVSMPVVGAVGGVAASEHDTDTSENDSGSEEYTIEELRRGGTIPGDSPDSVRIVADQRAYWVEHVPTDKPWVSEGDSENLAAGTTVGANEVFLRTIRLEPEPSVEDVTIVYWEKDTRTRETGNSTTVTEDVATDIRVTNQEVSFNQGWNKQQINLPQHDEKVFVTMWLTDHPEEGRWVFEHKSSATSRSSDINSQGDYWLRVIIDLLVPTLIGGAFAGLVARGAIKRAGVGPKWGPILWSLVVGTIGFISFVTMFDTLAEVLVDLPVIAPVGVVGFFFIVMIETHTDNLSKRLYVRQNTEDAVSPNGDKSLGWLNADTETHYVVDMVGGEAIVKKGFIRFLARVFGKAAYIENPERIKSRVKDNSGRYDEIVFVDPDSEHIVDYTPESFTLDLPDPDASAINRGLAITVKFAISIVPYLVVEPMYGAVLGVVASIPVAGAVWLTATDGSARINPAPIHYEDAMATAVNLSEETDEYRTNDALRRETYEQKASMQSEADRRVDQRDSTLISQMFDWDVDAGTASGATESGPSMRDDERDSREGRDTNEDEDDE